MRKILTRSNRSRIRDAGWEDVRPHLGRRVVCLIGAGCSVTGGLPTADELIGYLRHRDTRAYRKALDGSPGGLKYESLMKALPAAVRYQLFQDLVAVSRVNEAHSALALLIRRKRVSFALTTNFDDLLVRACALHGAYPAAHDLGSLARVGEERSKLFKATYLREPSILFLHGRHNGFWQVHHDDDRAQAGCLRDVLDNRRFHQRVWVIAGYSGTSDPLVGALREAVRTATHVVWVNPSRPADATLEALLHGSRVRVSYLDSRADEFFGRWAGDVSRGWRQAPRREFQTALRRIGARPADDSARRGRQARAAIERGERALRGRSGAAAALAHFKDALELVDTAASVEACGRVLEDGLPDLWHSVFDRYRAQRRCWKESARARLGEVRARIALGIRRGELEKLSYRLALDDAGGDSSDLQLASAYVKAALATADKLKPKVGGWAMDALVAALQLGGKPGAAAGPVRKARRAIRARSVAAARGAMLSAADQAAAALGR